MLSTISFYHGTLPSIFKDMFVTKYDYHKNLNIKNNSTIGYGSAVARIAVFNYNYCILQLVISKYILTVKNYNCNLFKTAISETLM